MSYEGIGDAYFMHKRDDLMGDRYPILECFTDPTLFRKKLLENVDLSSNYKTMSLFAFMAWAHSTLRGEEALKESSNRTHCGSVFNYEISDRKGKEREKAAARHTTTKTLLVGHMEKLGNVKYACHRVLLDTGVG